MNISFKFYSINWKFLNKGKLGVLLDMNKGTLSFGLYYY